MLKKGSKVKVGFLKEPKISSADNVTRMCSLSVSKKERGEWAWENYGAIIVANNEEQQKLLKDLKDGDKIIVNSMGITQNRKGNKVYYNAMIFDFELPDPEEEKKAKEKYENKVETSNEKQGKDDDFVQVPDEELPF